MAVQLRTLILFSYSSHMKMFGFRMLIVFVAAFLKEATNSTPVECIV